MHAGRRIVVDGIALRSGARQQGTRRQYGQQHDRKERMAERPQHERAPGAWRGDTKSARRCLTKSGQPPVAKTDRSLRFNAAPEFGTKIPRSTVSRPDGSRPVCYREPTGRLVRIKASKTAGRPFYDIRGISATLTPAWMSFRPTSAGARSSEGPSAKKFNWPCVASDGQDVPGPQG